MNILALQATRVGMNLMFYIYVYSSQRQNRPTAKIKNKQTDYTMYMYV